MVTAVVTPKNISTSTDAKMMNIVIGRDSKNNRTRQNPAGLVGRIKTNSIGRSL